MNNPTSRPAERNRIATVTSSHDAQISFVRFEPGITGRRIVGQYTHALSELPQVLPHVVLPEKAAGSLISFATYHPGATRGKEGVQLLHAIVLDFDGLYPGDLAHFLGHFASLGLGFWAHTSWSHHDVHKTLKDPERTQGPLDCFRCVFPLDRPCLPSEWEHIFPLFLQDVLPPWYAERYPLHVNGKRYRGVDPASERYAQGWLAPAASHALIDQAFNQALPGAPVDTAHYLRRAPASSAPAPSPTPATPLERVLAALQRLGRQFYESAPGQFMACCPSHPDTSPSLAVSEGDDGRALLHCFSGCGAPAIAQSLGLSIADLFVGLQEIVISTREHETIEAACEALSRDPDLYHRARRLVTIGVDESAPELGPQVHTLDRAAVRERLTRQAKFVKITEDKEGNEIKVVQHPPAWCVEALTTRGDWPGIRPLAGLLHAPTLREDGSLLTQEGYDPATRCYLTEPLALPYIPPKPPREHAHLCARALLDLVTDFPFKSDTDRAVWLALVLTRCARLFVPGVTPVFCLSATTAGSGKTLLGELACLVATGRPPMLESFPSDSDELRKGLHSHALAGSDCIFYDNVAGGTKLGGAALDMAVTAGVVGGRVLGKSETASAPLRVTWIATGNNLQVGSDLARRALWCRLEPNTPNPENRTGFKYPNLRQHVLTNRSFYLTCALTILRAYHEAADKVSPAPLGSFEAWRERIAGAVLWAWGHDPIQSQAEARDEQVDDAAAAQLALARKLYELKEPTRVSDLYVTHYLSLREALEAAVPGRGPDGKLTQLQLAHILRNMRGRVFRFETEGGIVQGKVSASTQREGYCLWRFVPEHAIKAA